MYEKDTHANKCKHEKRFLEGVSLLLFIISQIFALFGTQQQDFPVFSARETKQMLRRRREKEAREGFYHHIVCQLYRNLCAVFRDIYMSWDEPNMVVERKRYSCCGTAAIPDQNQESIDKILLCAWVAQSWMTSPESPALLVWALMATEAGGKASCCWSHSPSAGPSADPHCRLCPADRRAPLYLCTF